jgi:hypothetical protein
MAKVLFLCTMSSACLLLTPAIPVLAGPLAAFENTWVREISFKAWPLSTGLWGYLFYFLAVLSIFAWALVRVAQPK